MKIAFIGQKGIPAVCGGVEKHVESLATRLVKAGHEVIVYTRPNYTDKNLKEFKGVTLISLPSIGTKHLDAITHTFFACLDIIFRRKVDIVHFHAIGPSSLIWLIKIFKPSLPVVSTFHCQDYYHKKWGSFAQAYLKFGEFIACKLSDATIAVSPRLKKYSEEKYKKDILYIPNGVEEANFKKADKIKKWGLEKDNYILSVSRLVKHKGIHYLIEAFNNIRTDKKLVIAGAGVFTDDYVVELKELAKNNPDIIFTGNQTGDALSELYSNACVFVHPSESEGLSLALLEAMSYGLQIISSDIPENVEVLRDNGAIFRNKDAKDLEEKIIYFLNNPEDFKIKSSEGKKRAQNSYNWENICQETISLYEKVKSEKLTIITEEYAEKNF
ncbi:MAG: glycosyltransferase family 4 protein [Patescibacteria group bacterium]|nr:glycosyltransferase family 4 protein [Patescibacteria group bacterium]MDD4610957.1 glycosyltransferase family 4 protein [Patescibacteria group bacterium]